MGFRFLHVCGGVSEANHAGLNMLQFSPRMWRCFLNALKINVNPLVFSTYVEVFPEKSFASFVLRGFLHVCGGVSLPVAQKHSKDPFSPRMWRCFYRFENLKIRHHVFSTYVEVFPTEGLKNELMRGFLHVCGGVSNGIDENF